jgi:hypothetical protein
MAHPFPFDAAGDPADSMDSVDSVDSVVKLRRVSGWMT